jgi:hypothetical protein
MQAKQNSTTYGIHLLNKATLQAMLLEPKTGPDQKKLEKNRTKKSLTKNYIKYSKFEKKHVYSCASIQIQTIYTQMCKDSHLYSK